MYMVFLLVHINYDNHGDIQSKCNHKSNAPKKFKEAFVLEIFKIE